MEQNKLRNLDNERAGFGTPQVYVGAMPTVFAFTKTSHSIYNFFLDYSKFKRNDIIFRVYIAQDQRNLLNAIGNRSVRMFGYMIHYDSCLNTFFLFLNLSVL